MENKEVPEVGAEQIFLTPKHLITCILDIFLIIECQLCVTIAVIHTYLQIGPKENAKDLGII